VTPTSFTSAGIAFDRAGPRGDLPVVLLHAGVADRRMWDPLWPALTADRDVVKLDLRGFGESATRPRGVLSHVDDVIDMLTEVGIDHGHLAGASLGAGVAVEVALARPELVASLLLSAPGGSLIAEVTRRSRPARPLSARCLAIGPAAGRPGRTRPADRQPRYEMRAQGAAPAPQFLRILLICHDSQPFRGSRTSIKPGAQQGLIEEHLPGPVLGRCVVLALANINADEDVNAVVVVDHECSVPGSVFVGLNRGIKSRHPRYERPRTSPGPAPISDHSIPVKPGDNTPPRIINDWGQQPCRA
jgi:pimeloyl-ACP methyl ester carboxylesterase